MSYGSRQKLLCVMAVVGACSGAGAAPESSSTPPPDATTDGPRYDRIVEVVAGPESTCARSAGGKVACIGKGATYTEEKQAVDTHIPQVAPVPPSAAISAGAGFACSLDRDGGKVRCWGGNRFGQLGRKTRGQFDHLPIEVPDLRGIEQIVSHERRTCALGAEVVACWPGSKDRAVETFELQGREPQQALFVHARLGTLVDFSGHDSSWTPEVDAPWRIPMDSPCESVGIEDVGTQSGNLPDLGSVDCGGREPIRVMPDMEFGRQHACSLDHGRLQCEGIDSVGQIPATATSSVDFAVGGEHTCTVDMSGELRCWGSSTRGQLGMPPAHSRVPKRIATAVADAWVTSGLTCLRTRKGLVQCSGGLSDACEPGDLSPVDGPEEIRGMFSVWDSPGCLVDSHGSVWCAQDKSWEQVVPGTLFPGEPASRSQFTAHGDELCWVADGRPTCATWTTPNDLREAALIKDDLDRLRAMGEDVPPTPTPLRKVSHPFGEVSGVVQLHWLRDVLCARTADGMLHCIQSSSTYEDGEIRRQWESVLAPSQPALDLSGSGWVLADGTAQVVFNVAQPTSEEQLPRVRGHDVTLPPGSSAVQASGGCTLLDSGQVFCDDESVLGGVVAQRVLASEHHSCAVDEAGDLRCWGDATEGRLGAGEPICSRQPQSLTVAFHRAWEAAR